MILPCLLGQVSPGALSPALQQQQQELRQQERALPDVQREQVKPILEEPPSQAPSQGGDPVLIFEEVDVQGASVVNPELVRREFEQLRGREIRFSQLQEALNRATNIYRRQGFVTSRVLIPKGALRGGVLRVQVVEGFVESVEVIGRGDKSLKRWIRYYLDPLVSSGNNPRPLQFRSLERQVLLMQGFGGVKFNASLAKGSSFGASRLVVDLDPSPGQASLGINNNVQPQLGDYQLVGQMQVNVFHFSQPIQLNIFGSNAFPYGGGFASGSLGFVTPIGNRGWRLTGSGGLTSTSSRALPIPLGDGSNINLTSGGQSWLGNLGVRYPLQISRQSSLSMSFSGEFQNATNNTFLDDELVLSNPSRLRMARLGLDGSLSSPYYASSFNLRISQGLPIANAFDSVTFAASDGTLPSGSVSYTSARLLVRHQQRLSNSNAFVTATATGQVATNLLPGAEDFSYGGPFLGRAYRGSYLVGDQGAAAGLEFSWGFSARKYSVIPYLYGDYGFANNWFDQPTPPNYAAGSYGIGLRGSLANFAGFDVGWGIPIGPYPGSLGLSGVSHSIVYAQASVSF